MFASMFKSLFNKSDDKSKAKKKNNEVSLDIVKKTRQGVEDMLIGLVDIDKHSNCNSSDNDIDAIDAIEAIEAIENLSITDTYSENLNNDKTDQIDNSNSDVGLVGEKKQSTEDNENKKIINQINSLQCLFTWNIKSNSKKNVISWIQNKYGEYNLNISSPEFTLERYIGNLIIGYEMFHNNNAESAQMKILEIGKWLEELDNGNDEFYLSIKTGLKHVMTATFIHMLFATNLIEECKWLLNDINSFANMDAKSKAVVHAVRAASLIEYGGNTQYFKKACDIARKACDLDPNTSYWFYIYSLALTAQRHFVQSHKSSPTENEINAIQHAIMLSDGKNTAFNYHRMTLDRDTTIRNFHNNKNEKYTFEKNLQDNQTIVQMVKTIVSMEPKDPHIVIKCARTLMTLPSMVRDFNLGKEYLTKAFKMAPDDVSVLKAIEKTVELYNEKTKNNKQTTVAKQNISQFKNKISKLGEDLGLLVRKHKNGENVLTQLTNLVTNYDGINKSKVIAQICSYNILFLDNLKSGITWFMILIDEPGMKNNYLITQHFSSFGSRKFNLAELICNEIRLATNLKGTDSEDMLFYYKMLTKIMEICDVKINEPDSTMKTKLINLDTSNASVCSNTTYQSDTDSSDNEVVVYNKNISPKSRRKHKPKHLQNTGPKLYTSSNLNKETNKNNNSKKCAPKTATKTATKLDTKNATKPDTKNATKPDTKNATKPDTKNATKNVTKNTTNKTQNKKTDNIDQMKSKMSKFFNSPEVNPGLLSNNYKPLATGELRNLQTQAQIENYTQQLYQNILTNTQQFNLHNLTASQNHNRFFNQNHANLNSPIPPLLPNPHPPLLSLRPQINPQGSQSNLQGKKNFSPKKK